MAWAPSSSRCLAWSETRTGRRGKPSFALDRWQHGRAALAEADPREARAFAPAAEDHRVAVLEEGARLAVRERDRLLAAVRELQERAGFLGRRAGLRARADEVARPQVAAVHRVVRDQLRDRPVRVSQAGSRELCCTGITGTHLR